MGPLHELFERYGERVAFVVVYIREAHPEDGWVVKPNREAGIRVDDPVSDVDRHKVAAECALRLRIRMPVVIDAIDDRITSAYGALPDRLYLVGKGGRIAFQGERGPWGFLPDELEAAIRAELERIG